MSLIRGRDTKPELFIRSALHHLGYRYRLHVPDLPGKPDLVFPKYKAIIFVHGCFWHGHNCHLFKWPKSREQFWKAKIQKNRENDKRVLKQLRALDWRVLLAWECSIKGKTRLDPTNMVGNICRWLKSCNKFCETKGRGNKKNAKKPI